MPTNDQKTADYRLKIFMPRGPDVERVALTLIRTARGFEYTDNQQPEVIITTMMAKGPADNNQALLEVEAMRGKVTRAGGLLIPQRCRFEILQLPVE